MQQKNTESEESLHQKYENQDLQASEQGTKHENGARAETRRRTRRPKQTVGTAAKYKKERQPKRTQAKCRGPKNSE